MIKLTAIGNLGKDAIINQVNGKQVINFSIAHTEKFTSNGEQKEKTTWVECAYWSDSKVGAYLTKGTQVYIEGQPEVRTYEANGKAGASLTVRIFNIQLLGGGKKESGETIQPTAQPQNSQPVTQNNSATDNSELPF